MPYKDPADRRAWGRRYHLTWQNARRREYLEGKLCAHCGESDISKFHLHHVDPALKIHNKIWTWAEDRRVAELAKCIVLCRDCHIDVHRSPHGTQNRYVKYGCRCDECRAANARQQRRYRAARKAEREAV